MWGVEQNPIKWMMNWNKIKCSQDAFENPIMFLPHLDSNSPIQNPIIKMVVKNASELSLADSEQIEGVISSWK